MTVFNTLAPVFGLIALGMALSRSGFVEEAFTRGANRMVYYVGLPALLFRAIAVSDIDLAGHAGVIACFFIATTATILLPAAFAYVARMKGDVRGPFVQGSFRANLAYIGLPVVALSSPVGDEEALLVAVLLLAVTVPFYNVAAVVVLEAAKQRLGWGAVVPCVKSIATNPLVLACIAGGLANVAADAMGGPILPVWLSEFLHLLGQMTLPLALLAIGASLKLGEVRGHAGPILGASLAKTLMGPLAGGLLTLVIPVTDAERHALLVFLAAPTAAATFVMVDLIGGNKSVAAGIVFVSTVLSFPALFIVLLLYGVYP